MRNNEDRIGIQKPFNDSSIEVKQNLEIPIQTEFVDLPSKGKFYPLNHPLRDKEQIEIKFMTSREEDILTSKSLLKKGIAIDRFLQSIIVDKRIELNTLFLCDKNAIIIASRICGYGSDYSTKIICPMCEETIDYDFDLNDIKFNNNLDILDENGFLIVELPKTKANVCCKMLNGNDEKYLTHILESKRKHNLQETNMTDQMKMFIVSINGIEEQKEIYKFIENMPSVDSRHLRKTYQETMPNVDLEQIIRCPKCDGESEVTMPIGTTFFWPK